MASYFKQSGAWCARIRVKGHPELSKSAFRTKQDAQAWANVEEGKLRNSGASQGLGPTKTTLATGLLSYARQVTAYQAGCKQALTKINKYLRAGGMVPLRATKVAGGREFGLDADGILEWLGFGSSGPRGGLVDAPPRRMYFLGPMLSIRLPVCGSCLSGAMTSRHTDCLCGCPFVVVLLQCPAQVPWAARRIRGQASASAQNVQRGGGRNRVHDAQGRRLVPHQYKFRLETV